MVRQEFRCIKAPIAPDVLLVLKLLLLLATMGSWSSGSGVAVRGEESSEELAEGTDAGEGGVGPAVNPHIVVVKMWVMPRQHAARAAHRLDTMMCRHWKDISTTKSCTQIRALV